MGGGRHRSPTSTRPLICWDRCWPSRCACAACVPLHASGVAIDGRAVLFAGDAGGRQVHDRGGVCRARVSRAVRRRRAAVVDRRRAGRVARLSAGQLVGRCGRARSSAAASRCPPTARPTTSGISISTACGCRFSARRCRWERCWCSMVTSGGPGIEPLGPRDALVALRAPHLRHLLDRHGAAGSRIRRARGAGRGGAGLASFDSVRRSTTSRRQCLSLAAHVRHTIYRGVRPEARLPL